MQAIVTGGSRGIGLEITKLLLARGYAMHVLSRTAPSAPLTGATWWSADMADYAALCKTVDAIGTPDVLINNAGQMNPMTALDYDDAAIGNMLQVNLISAVRLSVTVAERMAAKGGGRIVSLGSIAGEIGHPDIWYGISKAGLANAMRSLARSHGPRGVVANTVAPGPIETDLMRAIPEDRKQRLRAATINQRFCTAQEVATTVCWLATDAPACINGEVFDVNNGVNYR
ncbi:SDR family NAD(P)-dependent oxidoreductase [Rugamonas apoptosis]|uniref:SDR family oxidoreductase n=1 Tax=Rugamonas apoptosis TaxID=2758570 RepID=A0A7W2F960_9BURK|nr:SDR family oxidoreductase [Rugamonas apoptosis]MBA5687433.1 SDR family oxidoreductase [Rugamonas apoptosis]